MSINYRYQTGAPDRYSKIEIVHTELGYVQFIFDNPVTLPEFERYITEQHPHFEDDSWKIYRTEY